MANLVIVESPAKASTIKGYLGSGYKVVASKGHVRDLPKSTLGIDIEDNFRPKYINIRGKGPLIKDLKKEAKSASKVFLATDPDREGEAISWHLAAALGLDPAKTKRVTFNEITKSAIREAIKAPRDIDMALVNSQQTRRILDRIVGYKLSPFLWKSVKSGLSAGRVLSVATRVIVDREAEIRAFCPEEYWTIDAELNGEKNAIVKTKFFGDRSGKIELHNQSEADTVVTAVGEGPFTVASVKKALRYKNPAPPFITSTLQQEAYRRLSFQSQRIMRVAQELYEGVDLGHENGGVQGLISYMRTDSLRISGEAMEAAKAFICEKYGEKFYPEQPRVYKSKNNAQDAHEAIRPSNMKFEPDTIKKYLTPDQFKLYRLIWNRFLASQMQSAELDTITAELEAGGYLFHTSGYTVKFKGYMTVYEETEEAAVSPKDDAPQKSAKLPALAEGDVLPLEKILPAQHFTEPPPRYSDATLIKFLEEKGIGRPSTYTPIITNIIARGYVTREGKTLKPTPLGEVTNRLMMEHFPSIVDYAFTAKMETQLDEVAHGAVTTEQILGGFYGDFEKQLENAEAQVSQESIEVPVEETDQICDKCGAKMIVKNGRFGKFAACPNYPECKNTMPLDNDGKPAPKDAVIEKTDKKCEICGSDMVLRAGRYGNFYACSHYPECKFTKPVYRETGVDCPLCGGKVVQKRGKRNAIFYSCENYPTCSFSSWDMPSGEKCPQCGKPLFLKKAKQYLYCQDKSCGYRKDLEPDSQENN